MMEIKGRECEEVKIGEDKLYFLSSYKGKEYRKIQEIQFQGTKVDSKGKLDMDASKLFIGLVDVFPVFCLDIVRGEEHIEPDVDYLDSLEVQDYIKIQDILSKKISEVVGGKKA